MIYDFPSLQDPIRQGDIFTGLPRVEFSLKELPVWDDNSDLPEIVSWSQLVQDGRSVQAIVGISSVTAIVISQDCDASRSDEITLCEIRNFRDVYAGCKETQSPKKWVNIITQHAKINQKWFYLPPDDKMGFSEKRGVDFLATLRILRCELEEYKCLRKGRLNDIAESHFREKIAEFFRRYPYDEWYSLDKEEFKTYRDQHADTSIEPFSWQK